MNPNRQPWLLKEDDFPVPKSYMELIKKDVLGPVLVLCCDSWKSHLQKYEDEEAFKVVQWDGEHPKMLHPLISAAGSVILAYKRGEDEMAGRLRQYLEEIQEAKAIYRLLRDLFLQISLQLKLPLVPEEKWMARSPEEPAYFVFAIPRSGSTFFCDILHRTNLLGRPTEHLLKDLIPVFLHTDFTFIEWIKALVKYDDAPNGIASSKIISYLFLIICDVYGERSGLLEELADFLKKHPVIYIKRRNLIRQAISLIKAEQSSVWHISNGEKILSEKHELQNDTICHEIDRMIRWLYTQERHLEEFFRRAGIIPRTYFYEQFSDEHARTEVIREVAASLIRRDLREIPETGYIRLSDDENESMYQDYLACLEKRLDSPDLPPDPDPAATRHVAALIAEVTSIRQNAGHEKTRRGFWRRWPWRLF